MYLNLVGDRAFGSHPCALCTGQDVARTVYNLGLGQPFSTLPPDQPGSNEDVTGSEHRSSIGCRHADGEMNISRSRFADIVLMQQYQESLNLIKDNALETSMNN